MLRIVFFGTPQFAGHILEYLIEKNAHIVAVVTKPDKPKGRSGQLQPPPVKVIAEKHGLQVFQPLKASTEEFAAILKQLNADLFFVVAYSEIFKDILLKMPRLGCVNVHASLLPKYRGAAPIHRAVMEGESETGVTIMSMEKELDAGEILAVSKTPILDTTTTGELFETLSHLGAALLWDVLCQFEAGTVKKAPQDHSKVTYAPKVTSEEGKIDWTKPAKTLHNHVRGLTPKPGAWCEVFVRGEKKRLLIKKTIVASNLQGKPGQIFPCQELTVATGEGALILQIIQLEGKKPMSSDEFLRGISLNDLSFTEY